MKVGSAKSKDAQMVCSDQAWISGIYRNSLIFLMLSNYCSFPESQIHSLQKIKPSLLSKQAMETNPYIDINKLDNVSIAQLAWGNSCRVLVLWNVLYNLYKSKVYLFFVFSMPMIFLD